MNAEYVLLPLGALCLGFPSTAMCSSELRGRLQRPVRRRYEGIGSLLRCRLNWIDFARAAAGTWIIQRILTGVQPGQDDIALLLTVAKMILILAVVLAQTVWLRRPVQIIGPAFYLSGLTLLLSGPLVGGFALLLGFTCALLLDRLSLIFTFVPIGIMAFGLLFKQASLDGLLNAVVFLMPAFLSFACRQRLAFARRPMETRVPRRAATVIADFASAAKIDESKVIRPDFKTRPIRSRAPRATVKIKPAAGSSAIGPELERPLRSVAR